MKSINFYHTQLIFPVGDGVLAKQTVGDGVLDVPHSCRGRRLREAKCRKWRPRHPAPMHLYSWQLFRRGWHPRLWNNSKSLNFYHTQLIFSVGDGVLDVPHRYVCIPDGIFISDGILCYKRRERHPREVRRGTRLPTSRKSKNPYK